VSDEQLEQLIREGDPNRGLREQEITLSLSEADFLHKVKTLIDIGEARGRVEALTPKWDVRKSRRLAVVGVCVLVVVALSVTLAGRRHSGPTIQGSGFDAPSGDSPANIPIVNGRYTKTVNLDGGALIVNPAPATDSRFGNLRSEASKIWATSQLAGYSREVVGFGLVTMNGSLKGINRVPAWIGFASDAQSVSSCPFSDSGKELPQNEIPKDDGQAAVVIESRPGVSGFVYYATSYVCSRLLAGRILPATEELSVPWVDEHASGKYSLHITASIPACGRLSGYSVRITPVHLTIAATALIPEDVGQCKSLRQSNEIVPLSPSGVSGTDPTKLAQRVYRHASIGPIPQALPRKN
jgi:hypothetical protein